jgi:hypothetical protein
MAPEEIERRYDALYEQYGQPLERDHRGEYAAISVRGEVALGQTMLEAAQLAVERFGPGSYLFKIGERTVGHWR